MQKLATAILFLFVTSLVGSTFAAGCMAAPFASATQDQIQESMPPCCAADAGCMAGSCFAAADRSGCTSDVGTVAVAPKNQLPNDLAKASAPVALPVATLTTIARADARRAPAAQEPAGIAGYRDIYARTGRLLI